MKKIVKIIFITSLLIFIAGVACIGFYVASVYSKAKKIELNEEKLTSPSLAIAIYDSDNKQIKEENMFNGKYIKYDQIPTHTIDAFTSIEDKEFFAHHGVNYKRIISAMLSNIKSGKLKEGASTITQQLVKNTQLTSEKTFERKIKEIALAKKLESRFSKENIMEQYLNIIYFGNNCYGIESASNYYFSKSAKDLDLPESALLAGMIKSPNRYSPIAHLDNALTRRNIVLDEMEKDGKITERQEFEAKNSEIKLALNTEKENKLNSFTQACIEEACSILGIPARQIALGEYKIFTYQDSKAQSALEESFSSVAPDCDYAGIILDNARHGVKAYVGNSAYNILSAKRQPGSLIKPLLVYAPAINEDIIYPSTQLLDEKTTIAGYNPKNVGEVYRGYVSAREALSKSINIPAVKVLSYVGIDKAKSYLEKMDIEFDEKDDSYALALGGMTYGTDIKTLSGAYSAFATAGKFASPKFISHITNKNGKLVYIHKPQEKEVFREDCAYLISDMLRTCAKEGTAKRLTSLNLDIASKTGTVGKPNSKQNLDAWNISYTKDTTCGVWLGNLDNQPISYAGGNQPTEIVKGVFSRLDDHSHFSQPDSIVERDIDLTELEENHRVVLSNLYTPERYTQKETFSLLNLPHDISSKWTKLEDVECQKVMQNGKLILTINTKPYITYNIYLGSIKEKNKAYSFSDSKGKKVIEIVIPNDKEKVYIESFYTAGDQSNKKINEFEVVKTINKSKKSKWYI